MKTYFVSADIHGFYHIYRAGLEEAGFDPANPDHVLVLLGDIFDRGREPLEILSFLRSLPPERRILIRGNHEYLLRDLIERGYPVSRDHHNGTYKTVFDLNPDIQREIADYEATRPSGIDAAKWIEWDRKYRAEYAKWEQRAFNSDTVKDVLSWIFGPEWRDYLETERYIFVHAFIPLLHSDYGVLYQADWREFAGEVDFIKASWDCPWSLYKKGYFDDEAAKGKTLVCGHWHTSDFYNNLDYPRGLCSWKEHADCPIYRSEAFPNLIGLDACTVLSDRVNVLVLGEDEL